MLQGRKPRLVDTLPVWTVMVILVYRPEFSIPYRSLTHQTSLIASLERDRTDLDRQHELDFALELFFVVGSLLFGALSSQHSSLFMLLQLTVKRPVKEGNP